MSSKISDERLAELRETAEAAQPGDWLYSPGVLPILCVRDVEDELGEFYGALAAENAKHVAAFDPPTVLALLAELAEYRAREAASEWDEGECETWGREHSRNCQCFAPLDRPRVHRLVGPWEAVTDDE